MNHTVAKERRTEGAKKKVVDEGERQKFTTESREITCAAPLHAYIKKK